MGSCGRILRNMDNFGSSISPTYKGHRQFKTPIGGLFSIFSLVILLAYILSESLDAILSDNVYTSTVYEIYYGSFTESGGFNVTSGNLNLAAKMTYHNSNGHERALESWEKVRVMFYTMHGERKDYVPTMLCETFYHKQIAEGRPDFQYGEPPSFTLGNFNLCPDVTNY